MQNSPIAFIGELLLRLSAPDGLLLRQSQHLQMYVGGAEANVAIALAQWGIATTFISALPDNDLGELVLEHLRKYGVDTQYIIRHGQRLGLYFYEAGEGLRSGKVLYDRQHSAFAQALPKHYPANALQQASWLHCTGITPVISEQAAQTLLWATEQCCHRGIPISIDLNLRKSLWNPTMHLPIFEQLLSRVDVVVADLTALAHMAAIEVDSRIFTDDPLVYRNAADQFFERYPNTRLIAFSIREVTSSRAFKMQYLICTPNDYFQSAVFQIENAIERIGAGDAATAAIIYALLQGFSYEKTANLAAAASAMKHAIKGDQLLSSIAEITALAEGNIHFSIKR
ncbi:MAG: sugar kinase [Cytophagales bacterium]|nr:sugar kinase [Bernardetiaceae bacterium]MDW8204696.1 sugar kinase [Cytophagales bacterium]